MGSPTKRAWKLNEFVAHGANVNCLSLGHKSGRVMVTGGDDKKVNMWAIGKPNCIMSLTGHTSPIQSVRFGTAEEIVVAGSLSGALKIWDLEQAKIVRTLTGHKSSITSLDFHPYGDFVASGSLDTNMKLWDIRRKGCIFTYKGHKDGINCIRFSPDGRWIVTAGQDTVLKLWDLTAGKLLTDFTLHSGPITATEFHPNEFLLASASADRTVKFWDLETFQLVSTTDGESTPIRSICFHPEGTCVYAGAQDQLKVYGWEPSRCFDSLSLAWSTVADIALASNQLIGATYSQSNVSTFVADVERIQPFGGPVYHSSSRNSSRDEPSSGRHQPPPQSPGTPMSVHGRRSFTERPATQSSKQQPLMPKEEPEDQGGGGDDDQQDPDNSANITNPDDYNQIFHPNKTLSRSPPKNMDPFPAPPDDVTPSEPVKVVQSSQPAVQQPAAFKPPPAPSVTKQSQVTSSKPPPSSAAAASSANHRANSKPAPAPARQSSNSQQGQKKQSEISAEDFLPAPYAVGSNSGGSYNMTEVDAMSAIQKGHDSMMAVMNSRGKNLQIVRALYSGGNMKTAMESAIGMDDKAIIVDLFNVMIQRSSLWNLDLCALAVPQIEELLGSKYESYVTSACSALKLILKNFASVIKSNLTAPPSFGVDITREERYNKCKRCYQQLMNIRSSLRDKAAMKGQLGSKYREVQLLMAQLD